MLYPEEVDAVGGPQTMSLNLTATRSQGKKYYTM